MEHSPLQNYPHKGYGKNREANDGRHVQIEYPMSKFCQKSKTLLHYLQTLFDFCYLQTLDHSLSSILYKQSSIQLVRRLSFFTTSPTIHILASLFSQQISLQSAVLVLNN